jgi:hypothetical protein
LLLLLIEVVQTAGKALAKSRKAVASQEASIDAENMRKMQVQGTQAKSKLRHHLATLLCSARLCPALPGSALPTSLEIARH